MSRRSAQQANERGRERPPLRSAEVPPAATPEGRSRPVSVPAGSRAIGHRNVRALPEETNLDCDMSGFNRPAITKAMMRAGRDAVQGSPLRSDRVLRTRLARVPIAVTDDVPPGLDLDAVGVRRVSLALARWPAVRWPRGGLMRQGGLTSGPHGAQNGAGERLLPGAGSCVVVVPLRFE